MKEFFGIISVLLAIIGLIPYTKDIFKGKTKPHLFSNIIWTTVTALIFFGQIQKGAGPGSWVTATMVLISFFIFILSFKYGTKDVTKLDIFFLIIGLFSIIPWWLTKDPTISVVIATIIDICGFSPTIRKTWNDPTSETLFTWKLNLIRHFISLFALNNFNLATYFYPLALLVINMIMVFVIIFRSNHIKKPA